MGAGRAGDQAGGLAPRRPRAVSAGQSRARPWGWAERATTRTGNFWRASELPARSVRPPATTLRTWWPLRKRGGSVKVTTTVLGSDGIAATVGCTRADEA